MVVKKSLKTKITWLLKYILSTRYNSKTELRFIIAPGRSGTTWVGNVLSKSSSKVRYISEPLPHCIPRIIVGDDRDISSYPLIEFFDLFDPYKNLIKKLSLNPSNGDFIPKYYNRKVITESKNADITIIKEVHAIFSVKAIVNEFKKAKFLFIRRNPIHVVDSFLSYKKEYDGLWEQEFENIINYYSLETFVKVNDLESDYIGKKIISVALQNNYLFNIKGENIKHVRYFDLCINRNQIFHDIFDFMDLGKNDKTNNYIAKLNVNKNEGDHRSIYRKSIDQVQRDMYVLNSSQVEKYSSILKILNSKGYVTAY